jgi:VIT1/CCC1 family predicted Fe2+/Mn2+ transporter
VRKQVPLHVLKEQHEVAGVAFAVIGGFYGVVLAFVLVASWERFERARADTEAEANAVGDLYRQSAGLPEPEATALRGQLVAYVHTVIDEEWTTMRAGSLARDSQKLYLGIWSSILAENVQTAKEVALFQEVIEKLDDFSEARRSRLLYMRSGLPPVIWYFLVLFGVVTVSFTYFFGMESLLAHAIITVVLASTIACTLFIIFEMQTPFSGVVLVPDRAFRVILPLLQPDGGAGADPSG